MSSSSSNIPKTSGSADTDISDASIIIFLPFVFIPASILFARLFQYIYRIYQAKKYGLVISIEDPLAHLGLTSSFYRAGTPGQIEKLQKEKLRLLIEQKKREEINLRALSSYTNLDGRSHNIIAVADSYLEDLQKRTKKEWYAKLSPAAMRRWLETSIYARYWMVLQHVVITSIAIGNYISLTYITNSSNNANGYSVVGSLDIFCASMFLIDYLVCFYVAEDRLKFYAEPMSLADLMSILSPFAYFLTTGNTKYVWFLGFVRIFRVTRIRRVYQVISFSQSETARELTIFALNFFIFMFLATSIVNAVESQDFEFETASLRNWHDSLYYIIGTFSTIGSDLIPSSTISRILVMFLMVAALIYIPWQTSKVIEVYNSVTPHQRARFHPKSNVSHIIVVGNVTFRSIRQFCRQFFQHDDTSTIVLLNPNKPESYLRKLLTHPAFQSRMVFLQGDPLLFDDLDRAKAGSATAVFILSSIFGDQNIDTTVSFISLTVKKHFPSLPIFSQLLDSKFRVLSSTCGIDIPLCMQNLRAKLIARNTCHQGIQTLITNLIHTCNEQSSEKIFGKYHQHWMKEYKCSLMNQIQVLEVPVGLVGMTLNQAALELYTSFNVILFFISEPAASPILKWNSRTRLQPSDSMYIIGDGRDELLLQITFHYQFFDKPIEIAGGISLQNLNPSYFEAEYNGNHMEHFVNEQIFASSSSDETLINHVIVMGNAPDIVLADYIVELRKLLTNISILIIFEQVKPFSTSPHKISNLGNADNLHFLQGNITDKSVLEEARADKCKEIVFFSENQDSKSLFISKLVQYYWPGTRLKIELCDGDSIAYFEPPAPDQDSIQMKNILTNASINVSDRKALYSSLRTFKKPQNRNMLLPFFTYLSTASLKASTSTSQDAFIHKSNTLNEEKPFVDSEFEQRSEKRPADLAQQLLQQTIDQNDGLSPYPLYHFDPQYATGNVCVSEGYLNALLCHSYFKPYLIDVIEKLVDHLIVVPASQQMIGKSYLEVAEYFYQNDAIPFGIYRQEGQFVYTNPRHGDVVKIGDMLYIIRNGSQ